MQLNLSAALKVIGGRDWADDVPMTWGSFHDVMHEVLTALCSEPECTCDPDHINGWKQSCPIHGVAKSPTTVADKGRGDRRPIQAIRDGLFWIHGEVPPASAVDDTAKGTSGLKEGDKAVWNGVRGIVDFVTAGFGSVRFVWNTTKEAGRLVEFAWIKPSRLRADGPSPKSTNPGHTEPDRSAQPGEEVDLKPCGYCGSARVDYAHDYCHTTDKTPRAVRVLCVDCGIGTEWMDTEEDAAEVWNRRVTPQAFTAEFMLLVLEGIHSLGRCFEAWASDSIYGNEIHQAIDRLKSGERGEEL